MSRTFQHQVSPIESVMLMNPSVVATPDPFLSKAAAAFMAGSIWLDPFRFTLTWDTLAASAVNQSAKQSIDAGVDLLVTEVNLVAFAPAGTSLATPDYLLELEDSTFGKWSDAPHHVGLWMGARSAAGLFGNLPIARYLRGSGTITGRLTNLTATAARVDLGLAGWRVSYNDTTREILFGPR